MFPFLHLFLVENTVKCGGSLRSRREKRPGKLRPALRRWAKLLRARPHVLVTRGPGLVAKRAGLAGSPRMDSWVLEVCPRTQSRDTGDMADTYVGTAGLAAAAWLRSRRPWGPGADGGAGEAHTSRPVSARLSAWSSSCRRCAGLGRSPSVEASPRGCLRAEVKRRGRWVQGSPGCDRPGPARSFGTGLGGGPRRSAFCSACCASASHTVLGARAPASLGHP